MVVGRDDGGLAGPVGQVVVDQDDLDAGGDRGVEGGLDLRSGRRDGDALHALRDHRLDDRDLALVVVARRALAGDQLDVRVRRRPFLGGVLDREEEVDRELRDEPELDLLGRGRGRRGAASDGAAAVAAVVGAGAEAAGLEAPALEQAPTARAAARISANLRVVVMSLLPVVRSPPVQVFRSRGRPHRHGVAGHRLNLHLRRSARRSAGGSPWLAPPRRPPDHGA